MNLKKFRPIYISLAITVLIVLLSCERLFNHDNLDWLEKPLPFPPDTVIQFSKFDDLTIETDAYYWVDLSGMEQPFCFLIKLRVKNDSGEDITDFGLDKVAIFSYEENSHLKTLDASPRINTQEENLILAYSEVELQFGQKTLDWKNKGDLVGKKAYSKARIKFNSEFHIITGPSRIIGGYF